MSQQEEAAADRLAAALLSHTKNARYVLLSQGIEAQRVQVVIEAAVQSLDAQVRQ